MFTLKSMSSHEQALLRQERLVFQCSLAGNAVPADKGQESDIPGLTVFRTEGQTAAADAVETITWTSPVDDNVGDSVFGILLNLDENKADKVYSVSLVEADGPGATYAVTGPNAVAGAYLTAAGNIAIEVAATGLNLASDDVTFLLRVDYRELDVLT